MPEDQDDLGQQFGELIKAFCTAEPEGLLDSAVHRAMLRLLCPQGRANREPC